MSLRLTGRRCRPEIVNVLDLNALQSAICTQLNDSGFRIVEEAHGLTKWQDGIGRVMFIPNVLNQEAASLIMSELQNIKAPQP